MEREVRGNEEREKREDEKGSYCFFKSSGYYKLEHKHQKIFFYKLIECIVKKKCHYRQRIELRIDLTI